MLNKFFKIFIAIFLFSIFLIFLLKIMDISLGSILKTKKLDYEEISRSVLLKERSPKMDIEIKDLDNNNTKFRTDNEGFLIGQNNIENNESVDIIFFGGSTTECWSVKEDNRFPYLVSNLLINKNGDNIKTLNSGVSGNHSVHSFINFFAKGIKLKPKNIVILHSLNDINYLFRTKTYWEGPENLSVIQTVQNDSRGGVFIYLKKFKDVVLPNTWILLRSFIYHRIDKAFVEPDEWAGTRGKSTYSLDELKLMIDENFSNSLLSFINVSRIWGIEPILMTQFNRYKIDDNEVRDEYNANLQPVSYDDFVELYKLGNDIVRKIAIKNNVQLIDLDKRIDPSSKYMYDSIHLNDNGSIKVAQIISEVLATKFDTYSLISK
jgi:hypothetical protein